jgi:hypothetical protein
MEVNGERLLFALSVLMVIAYLVHPDDTTKTLTVMSVGGFLTVVKQTVDHAIDSLKATVSKGTATVETQDKKE